jgi:hemolysin III
MEFLDFREPVSAWSHALGLLLALPATLLLLRRSRGSALKQVSLLVYGLTLAVCYGCSALYHGVRVSPAGLEWYVTADYVGIYLLVAGTITPVVLVLLEGRWRWGALALTWALAAGGIALRVTVRHLPMPVSTALYLVLGWGVLGCYSQLARALPPRGLGLVLLGGAVYTTGAVLNMLHWPALWPGVVGPHEVFHAFVLGGSLCHFLFALWVLAPFERPFSPPVPLPAALARPVPVAQPAHQLSPGTLRPAPACSLVPKP